MVKKDFRPILLSTIDNYRDEMIQTLSDLVHIPSLVGEEGKAQAYMADLYRRIGLEVRLYEADEALVKDHPAYIPSLCSYQGRPNVIGTLPGDPASHSLILNGHIDVVSPEPLSEWTHDPFGAEIVDGVMYGRGAADCKAGLVANAFAAKALIETGYLPAGTLMLHSVIEEEGGGGGGTLACLLKGYTADAMAVTEAHSLRITWVGAGVCYFRVSITGKTAHGGRAHLGISAIDKLYRVYRAIQDLDVVRSSRIKFEPFEIGSGKSCHINIGKIQGGDWISTVPGWASFEGRLSFVPGETLKGIHDEFTAAVMEAAKQDPWLAEHPPRIDWFGWQAEPWMQDRDHEFVKTFKIIAEEVLGREVQFMGRASGLDCRFAPYFKMQTFGFGAIGRNAHGVDENVDLQSIVDTAKIHALNTLAWCGLRQV